MEITTDQYDALVAHLDAWERSDLAGDLATQLTCGEVNALVGLLVAFGRQRAAQQWISAHAEGDDCGDEHCTCPHCALATPA
ncbi:hypothetical protein [Mycolicibacterium fallax]|uniref:hypothetical protein n=1 Tax=Mycolicibacterium fallax TaxID=1793 RepID=UPI001A99649A|nr:hypothetical protein [Mycolicibacterium fallax]